MIFLLMRFFLLLLFCFYPVSFVLANTTDGSFEELAVIDTAGSTDGKLCTYDGTGDKIVCATSSGGGTLDALGDVILTSPVDNSLLRYNSTSSVWEDVELQTGLGATTIVSGWPDAIRCYSPSIGEGIYFLAFASATNVDGLYYYRMPYAASDRSVRFNSDKTYHSYQSLAVDSSCDNKSISQLYASGRAYNLMGGGSVDDLGNHTATQNIVMGSQYLSGDGGDEGLTVNSDGDVAISGDVAVNGSLKMNTSSPACDSESAVGMLRFNATNGRIEICRE